MVMGDYKLAQILYIHNIYLVGAHSVKSGLEPSGEVFDGVEQERQQTVLHLAVELLLYGLGKRPAVLVLVHLSDAGHLLK